MVGDIMNADNIESITGDIKSRVLGFDKESKAIIDISVYPELGKMLEIGRTDFQQTYYFPDTITKLVLKAKENEQYYYFITKLLTRWTHKYIDFKMIDKIFIEKEFPMAKIELITEDIIDKEVYSFCYKNFVSKDLVIEFSPRFNLVGDLIGKILGFAKKSKTPILMMNQRLVHDVKKLIPTFDTANMFVDRKQRFFGKFIPLKRTRGVRWFVGITVGTMVSPVGFILAVIDP